MRPIRFLLVAAAASCLLFHGTPVSAGRIFGDIRMDGKPVPEGLKVRVVHATTGAVADTTVTDKFGSFKLMVKGEGKYVLTVVHDKQPVEVAVFSNKEATRYDLVLEKKDGKMSMRRK
jgi:hypothetical protein